MRERKALDTLSEAVVMLRSSSPATIALYLVGAVPFTLGLLFFFADMAQSQFAADRILPESLGIAILFVWKGVCQALFAARLYEALSLSRINSRSLFSVVTLQFALQPLSLLVIPLSLFATIPFAWTVAFFRHAGMFAALGDASPMTSARQQATTWTSGNWKALGLISLAGVLLFVNFLIVIMLLPQVGRSFLGVESDFSRLGLRLLNPMTLAVALSLTWLILDPLLEALYVLRCFYGLSLATGEDLRVSLRKLTGVAAGVALMMLCASVAQSQTEYVPSTQQDSAAQSINESQLRQSIDNVVHRSEFAWRVPKAETEGSDGWLTRWARSAMQALKHGLEWLGKKLDDWFRDEKTNDSGKTSSPRPSLELWIAMICVLLVGVIFAVLLRWRRAPRPPTQATPVVASAPDLTDESITADQLPESGWIQLAEEWRAKGDLRMALRALYLAGLRFLSARHLVSIHRAKTGRDYRRELERNSRLDPRVLPNISPAFAENVTSFERGWYGRHAVGAAEVDTFLVRLEELRRYADGKA